MTTDKVGSYRKNRHGRRVQTINTEPSMTKQSDTYEADVNTIMDRYLKTGDPSMFMKNTQGIYADVSAMGDYQTCLAIVEQAKAAFDALDAPIRDRFANNPANLINAISDPAMKDELTELGIFEKPTQPAAPAAQTGGKSPDAKPADTKATGS